MHYRPRKPRGFSLIEMLVVISIIAALAAILLPVLTRAKARAQRMACISNMKQMGLALKMYRDDYRGSMPFRVGAVEYITDQGWTGRLRAYNDTVDLFRCPSDYHYFSYGMNAQAMSRAAPPEGPSGDVDDPFKESDVRSPSKLIVIYECPGSGERTDGGGQIPGDSDITNEDGQDDGRVYGTFDQRRDDIPITSAEALHHFNWLYFPGRHNGGNNLLFWDGHVDWFHDWEGTKMTFRPSKQML